MKFTHLHEPFCIYSDKPHGNNLWVIRQELHLSQQKFADLCGLNIGVIARMERGDQQVDDKRKQIIKEKTGYRVEIYR